MGAFGESSREGSFERATGPVTLVTAQTNDTIQISATPAEAITKGKVELLKKYKMTHEMQTQKYDDIIKNVYDLFSNMDK